MTPAARADRLKGLAGDLGFASCGITDLSPPPHADALDRWLTAGMSGTMAYLPRQAARRKAPARILPGATRAVVLTWRYPDTDVPCRPGAGKVARYARGRDYHDALAPALERLEREIRGLGGPETLVRSYLDAGPVPERELAQRSGLGWIGKNTMLIDPRRGSYCFIAAILTDLDLTLDPPFEADRCGSCTRCLDACPTAAFPEPHVLDARRCISYLTIEYRGEIPAELGSRFENWIFGCDICQEVCPWNVKFAGQDPAEDALERDETLGCLDLDVVASIGAEEFNRRFGHTPLARPGAPGMRRNARAVLGQSPVG